ncbi:MAG: ribosome small subunit-dependent GTPase A [Melioribacteraceae bacterium]|nr:ribosome small subunit-dependent GTPase A [Melioribacteraceae bacterium]
MLGRVHKIESKDYYVFSGEKNIVRCSLRGIFKKEYSLKKDKQYKLDIVAVGDVVELETNADGTGVIYNIHKRKNYLSRKAPRIKGASYRGERLEQIIASNLDNIFIVASVKNPKFNNRLIDRIIVAAESSHIAVHIIINKTDLDKKRDYKGWVDIYNSLGYEVIPTNKFSDEGIEKILTAAEGKTNIFWGMSGVGKSTILNRVHPQLNLKIGDIGEKSGKGQHTTVTAVMNLINANTAVIDTPGIREIDPYGITQENLGHYFVEFEEFINECRFNSCTHNHEPGCAVQDAFNDNLITEERFESYLNMLDSIEDDMIF